MTHPYTRAAAHRLWRKSVTTLGDKTDPVVNFPFKLSRQDKVVAAGSCFAQHISGRLRESGFSFLVTEMGHPLLDKKIANEFNYGRFSARYGNIYTARQLLQLLRRAYGRFSPVEDKWVDEEGRFVDPFRPQIQPDGFASELEYELDREQHFAAVRTAFEAMDVLVFTLGLTECWENIKDGAVFPVCPGTAGGRFDPARHRFRNQDVAEIVDDMTVFLQELHVVNVRARVILTVSPVPLVATARDVHVLPATVYSKSVLRVAAETLVQRHENVAYFPSYEIITGPQARGQYFDDDLRSVKPEGVDRVMELFFRHVGDQEQISKEPVAIESVHDQHAEQARKMNEALCDELMLDNGD
ncbi:GSCFA domain-containing protein [Ensifer canadensis]